MSKTEVQQSTYKYPWRPKLWREIKPFLTSPSHSQSHLGVTNAYAHALSRIYGGDQEVISAAVTVHDLGRHNPSIDGQESIEESIRLAKPMLINSGFPREKIDQVLKAVEGHASFEGPKPSTQEAKILFDADKLSGIGVLGVRRIRDWWNETGKTEEEAELAIKNRMPLRVELLHFEKSKEVAQRSLERMQELKY